MFVRGQMSAVLTGTLEKGVFLPALRVPSLTSWYPDDKPTCPPASSRGPVPPAPAVRATKRKQTWGRKGGKTAGKGGPNSITNTQSRFSDVPFRMPFIEPCNGYCPADCLSPGHWVLRLCYGSISSRQTMPVSLCQAPKAPELGVSLLDFCGS